MGTKTVTIMPDFCGALYAWEKVKHGEARAVGGRVARGSLALRGGCPVTEELQRDFIAWAIEFDRGCRDADFDWTQFHERGLGLARRLKRELGDSARVVYARPAEDPGSLMTRRTELMSDGSLRPIDATRFAAGESRSEA